MKKRKHTINPKGGLVYSTDPGIKLNIEEAEQAETPAPALQKLRIRLDTRNRAGKAVTLVEGFTGKVADRDELGKKLKSSCGTGGSVKGDEILIQGDNRDKVFQWLMKNGFVGVRKV